MHAWEGIGYWTWGLGTVLLGMVFALVYVVYRRSGDRRGPGELDRMARQNAAARSEKAPDDVGPARPRDVRPLVVVICAALVAGAIVLGLTWLAHSPTFGSHRAPIAQAK